MTSSELAVVTPSASFSRFSKSRIDERDVLMPSRGRKRLTDDLWLAAHDGVKGARLIGDWPLGIGSAAGLLAELVSEGFLELRQGELFRTSAELPTDPALRPLLVRMEAEEQAWPRPAPPLSPVPTAARTFDDGGWNRNGRPPSVRHEIRHRLRGHQLTAWMAYLAYEGRAEARVVDRLSRTGLVRCEERRRLFGGPTVRYVPCDSNASGSPANLITQAVQAGRALSWSESFLAGLFLATGLHHHAFATLSSRERSSLSGLIQAGLAHQVVPGLRAMLPELLRAADAAVGEAAMR